jgi:hypothetical protein
VALTTINRDRGSLEAARAWARKLAEVVPEDPRVAGLIAELEAQAAARPGE